MGMTLVVDMVVANDIHQGSIGRLDGWYLTRLKGCDRQCQQLPLFDYWFKGCDMVFDMA